MQETLPTRTAVGCPADGSSCLHISFPQLWPNCRLMQGLPNKSLLINIPAGTSKYARHPQPMPDPSEVLCTAPNPCMHAYTGAPYSHVHDSVVCLIFMYSEGLCVDGVTRTCPSEVTAPSGHFFPFFPLLRVLPSPIEPFSLIDHSLPLFFLFPRANCHVPQRPSLSPTAVRLFATCSCKCTG